MPGNRVRASRKALRRGLRRLRALQRHRARRRRQVLRLLDLPDDAPRRPDAAAELLLATHSGRSCRKGITTGLHRQGRCDVQRGGAVPARRPPESIAGAGQICRSTLTAIVPLLISKESRMKPVIRLASIAAIAALSLPATVLAQAPKALPADVLSAVPADIRARGTIR